MAKAKEAKEIEPMAAPNKQAFIARKLAVLNQKHGAMYERAADRVVQNNL